MEFGAWDGKWLSNTYNLLAHGNWQGVYIEGDPQRYQELLKTKAVFPDKLHTICAMVAFEGEGKLDNLLARTPIPNNFDLLSIDIDSYDWQVWNALEQYQPKLVIIECNCTIPPGAVSIHNPPASQGASFTALVDLDTRKGYQLVCHTGNCFFVRNELVPGWGFRRISWPRRKDCLIIPSIGKKKCSIARAPFSHRHSCEKYFIWEIFAGESSKKEGNRQLIGHRQVTVRSMYRFFYFIAARATASR